ncbi:MAG: AsmA family protein [Magnetococcales bacterium]|nr:AsmA family protein [Magnetococcales bacterium]MBF0114775.1 AsmA family protein [Magnetococcales bacterium]
MFRLFKWLLGTLLMLLLAAGSLLWLLDVNTFKEPIVRLVAEKTGRRLTIQGEMALTLFPHLGLRLGKMALANAEGFSAEPFAELGSAYLQLAPLPLLKRQWQVESLSLEGVRLNLEKSAAGQYNWHDLLRAPSSESNPDTPTTANIPAPPATAPGNAWATRIAITELQLRDARIRWQDLARQESYTVVLPLLATGEVVDNQPLPLQLQLRLEEDSPVGPLELHLQGSLLWQWQEQVARMTPLRLSVHRAAQGEKREITLQSHANLLLDWRQERLVVEDWQLSGHGLQVQGNWEVKQLRSAPQGSGVLTFSPFSPRALLAQWGVPLPATRDEQRLNHVAGKIPFLLDREHLALNGLQLKLDESTLQGELTLENFAHPQWRWDLQMDRLQADSYRPVVTEQTDTATATRSAAATPDRPAQQARNPQGWQTLTGNGKVRIGQLQLANLHLQEVELTLQAEQGRLQVAPLQAKLYQGQLHLEGSGDLREESPPWRLNGRMDGVQLQTLLQDWHGESRLSGSATVNAQLTSRGHGAEQLKKHLQGQVKVLLKEGRLYGIDLERELRDAYRRFKGEPPVLEETPPFTPFNSVQGSATIHNGLLDNRDLKMVSPLFLLRGAGKVDLAEETVDYRLQLTLDETALRERGGRSLQELQGVAIPVQASGALRQPTWKVDVKSLLEQEAAHKAKEKLADKLQDKATEALKKKGLEHLLPPDAGKRLLNILPMR